MLVSLLPPTCLLCGSPCPHTDRDLCPGCDADLPWIHAGCQTCALPLPPGADQLQCGECLTDAPPFQLAIIPLQYRDPVGRLVTGFKHRRQLQHGKLLGELLGRELQDHYLLSGGNRRHMREVMPELILPVPLHWTRWWWRGYNQSALLGRQIGRQLGLPCRDDILQRVRRTPSQQGLGRAERLHNLQQAFCVTKPVPYRRVALLDDVVTTGATSMEIGHLLLQHGVEEVHLWAIARTPV